MTHSILGTIGEIRQRGLGFAYQLYQQGMAQISIFYTIVNFLLLVTINPYVAHFGGSVLIGIALALLIIPLGIGIVYNSKVYHNQFLINPYNRKIVPGKEKLLYRYHLEVLHFLMQNNKDEADADRLQRMEAELKELIKEAE